MPYLNSKIRGYLDQFKKAAEPGELNYLVTELIIDYLTTKGLKYAQINEVVGALECCKLEFYRRVAAPYEELKITENGEVYPDELLSKNQ